MKITAIQSQVHVDTTYRYLPLLSIGSKIYSVFLNVSYDIACQYILLQKAITKSSSFLRKGKSAISFLHVVINSTGYSWFELFSTMI